MYNDILNFCFEEVGSEKFFEKDIAFDKLLIERYSDTAIYLSKPQP